MDNPTGADLGRYIINTNTNLKECHDKHLLLVNTHSDLINKINSENETRKNE